MNPSGNGWLNEIFTSIQGEGVWVGRRQLFVRLAGCSRNCVYCDTAQSRRFHPKTWTWKSTLPERGIRQLANPVAAADLAERIAACIRREGPFHSVAITGGEPLEQAAFVRELTRNLKRALPDVKCLLETNGLEYAALPRLKGLIHYIAADIKLKSACQTARPERHRRFLDAARWAEGCVKVVVTPDAAETEIRSAARLARKHAPMWDFVLQPAAGFSRKVASGLFDHWLRSALAVNPRARLIPQLHRFLGID